MEQLPTATLSSFPKSGRTWLRVMLDRLGIGVNLSHEGSGHTKARHFEELTLPAAERLATKRVFLVRDPRDTVVSGFFQLTRRLGGSDAGLGPFIRDPRHGIEKVIRFNLMWLESAAPREAFLPVTYEDLHADTAARLTEISRFLGHNPSADLIVRVVEASSFDNMQREERDGRLAVRFGEALTPRNLRDPDSFKVRRGKVGGFRDHLAPEDIAYCDGLLARHDYQVRLLKSVQLRRGDLF